MSFNIETGNRKKYKSTNNKVEVSTSVPNNSMTLIYTRKLYECYNICFLYTTNNINIDMNLV